jgi:hypothetical protein
MEQQFEVAFGDVISFTRAVLRDAEHHGALQKIQEMTHKAIAAGRVEKERRDPGLHLYADGEGGVEVGERDIRFTGDEAGGDVGGEAEGDAGGEEGGDAGGDAAADAGADAGGDAEGDAEGDAGGDDDGDAEGDAGGDVEGDAGGDDEGNAEGDAAGDAEGDAAEGDAAEAGGGAAAAAAQAAAFAEAAEAAAKVAADAGGRLEAAFASDVPITAEIAFFAVIADMRAYLRAMHAYLVRRVSASYGAFPLRLASYWHPTRGSRYLQEDYDKYMPMKEVDMGAYLASGAWQFGFWNHPDLAAEIDAAVQRGGNILVVLPPGASVEDLPREGVSLGLKTDDFYDAYFGFASPESMWTERALGAGAYTRPLFG